MHYTVIERHNEKVGNLAVSQKTEEYQNLINTIQVLDSHLNKVRERDEARTMLQSSQHAQSMIADFRRQLSDIYREPELVFDFFAATALASGVETAVAKLTEDPEVACALKGWSIGPLHGSARTAILKLSLPMALKTGSSGFRNHIKAGGGAYSGDDMKARTERLKSRLEHLESVAGAAGDRITLELKVAESTKKVRNDELQKLSREHYKLVEDLVHKCKPLLVEQSSKDGEKKLKQQKQQIQREAAQDVEIKTEDSKAAPEAEEKPVNTGGFGQRQPEEAEDNLMLDEGFSVEENKAQSTETTEETAPTEEPVTTV